MKKMYSVWMLLLLTATSDAKDDTTAPTPTPGFSSLPARDRPRGMAPGLAAAEYGAAPASSGEAAHDAPAAPPAATFTTKEQWGLAGYNNNEPIYTIVVTSQDTRVIRCTAELKGIYIENGVKLSIADRQTVTVFPSQHVQIGNWSGLDQASGATYAVKCRPV